MLIQPPICMNEGHHFDAFKCCGQKGTNEDKHTCELCEEVQDVS